MELASFCMILLLKSIIYFGPSQSEASLSISPSRCQFFQYLSISLSCEEQVNSTGWTIKRKTTGGGNGTCGVDWGISAGVPCVITVPYQWDSGEYWCESESGERSHPANITVTDGAVILESPVLPVTEGAAVTLRCLSQDDKETSPSADFYKDGTLIRTESTGQMTIQNVYKSDEGTYKCNISGLGESPESWLAVRAPVSTPDVASDSDPPPSPAPLMSLSRLICHLVVGILYLVSTILLALIYRDKAKYRAIQKQAQCDEERRGCDDVVMEIAV